MFKPSVAGQTNWIRNRYWRVPVVEELDSEVIQEPNLSVVFDNMVVMNALLKGVNLDEMVNETLPRNE
ncbi:hypothetical protein BpHYR1_046423 [Brachionus plicatilis]|uniref:Uncharacterized protein n=1 Tax=Brachionus plicatilis TaxID=10195 RepID=A0A3M7PPW3_BRAPC|nr:hypothetical protein BpHYR1_046423 [Brachionus plicatilis]